LMWRPVLLPSYYSEMLLSVYSPWISAWKRTLEPSCKGFPLS
jgi:hypothetical protein